MNRNLFSNISFINLTIAQVISCEAFLFVTILPIMCLLKKNNSKRAKKTSIKKEDVGTYN